MKLNFINLLYFFRQTYITIYGCICLLFPYFIPFQTQTQNLTQTQTSLIIPHSRHIGILVESEGDHWTITNLEFYRLEAMYRTMSTSRSSLLGCDPLDSDLDIHVFINSDYLHNTP